MAERPLFELSAGSNPRIVGCFGFCFALDGLFWMVCLLVLLSFRFFSLPRQWSDCIDFGGLDIFQEEFQEEKRSEMAENGIIFIIRLAIIRMILIVMINVNRN